MVQISCVIANSVLSHLTEDACRRWLEEVARWLKRDGIALLSYHGNCSSAAILSNQPAMLKSVQAHGFNADLRATELDSYISDDQYYRQTFMSDSFARALFAEHFDVIEIVPGLVSRYQNVAVLKRA